MTQPTSSGRPRAASASPVRVVVASMVLAAAITGCGRLGFGDRIGAADPDATADGLDGGTAVDGGTDAGIDAPIGATCSTDSECGRCARCDTTNRCVVEPITELFLGHRTTCYVGAGGERWCAGANNRGQLGLGDTVDRLAPERALDGGRWSFVRNSYYGRALGVRDGQFHAWGDGTLLPVATGPSRAVRAVLGDINALCLWELDGTSTCPGASGAWTSLAVGGDHSCGVRGDGSLWCWGTNRSGSLGDPTLAEEEIVAAPRRVGAEIAWRTVEAGGKGIATANGGNGFTCATKADGRIYCWGHPTLTGTGGVNVGPVPTAVSADTNWTWFRLDWEHACAGKADGSVWCWGADTYGGYVVPGAAAVASPTQIAGTYQRWLMGGHHACGLTGGRWRCFGLNAEGQLGIGTSTSDGQFVELCP